MRNPKSVSGLVSHLKIFAVYHLAHTNILPAVTVRIILGRSVGWALLHLRVLTREWRI